MEAFGLRAYTASPFVRLDHHEAAVLITPVRAAKEMKQTPSFLMDGIIQIVSERFICEAAGHASYQRPSTCNT